MDCSATPGRDDGKLGIAIDRSNADNIQAARGLRAGWIQVAGLQTGQHNLALHFVRESSDVDGTYRPGQG